MLTSSRSLCFLGILHLLYACVCMMFWRVFMRISYSCPAHLKFSLTVEQWTELVTLTSECIDWLDANDRVYDVWLFVAYAATSCALVQVRPVSSYFVYGSLTSFAVPYLYSTERHHSPGQTAPTSGLREEMGRLDLSRPHVSSTQGTSPSQLKNGGN